MVEAGEVVAVVGAIAAGALAYVIATGRRTLPGSAPAPDMGPETSPEGTDATLSELHRQDGELLRAAREAMTGMDDPAPMPTDPDDRIEGGGPSSGYIVDLPGRGRRTTTGELNRQDGLLFDGDFSDDSSASGGYIDEENRQDQASSGVNIGL